MNAAANSDGHSLPDAEVRREGQNLVLALKGEWSLKTGREMNQSRIFGALEKEEATHAVRFDVSDLKTWDTSLLIFLLKVEDWCRNHNVDFRKDSLPRAISGLIALSQAVPEKQTGRSEKKRRSFFYRLGAVALAALDGIQVTLDFTGQCALSVARLLRGKAAFDWRLFWLTMQECSAQALPIVGLISFLTGLILAFVGAIQLRQFGAGIYVANLVAVAMAREMGAIMTGVIMAGRTGAAFAAQIGSMKVSEEIDALKTLAISPIDFLVSPRMLALFLMMPLLCLYSILIGIAGGAVVGVTVLNLSLTQYWNQTLWSMGLTDIATGVAKSAVFGVIIALTGCQRGIGCGNDAAAVGRAATSAVVLAITWIVATDAIIDVIQQLGNF
jgi:phospholipid/cholesterol/gamma-HCH transport system permease protein